MRPLALSYALHFLYSAALSSAAAQFFGERGLAPFTSAAILTTPLGLLAQLIASMMIARSYRRRPRHTLRSLWNVSSAILVATALSAAIYGGVLVVFDLPVRLFPSVSTQALMWLFWPWLVAQVFAAPFNVWITELHVRGAWHALWLIPVGMITVLALGCWQMSAANVAPIWLNVIGAVAMGLGALAYAWRVHALVASPSRNA